jgi:hypothetical protein
MLYDIGRMRLLPLPPLGRGRRAEFAGPDRGRCRRRLGVEDAIDWAAVRDARWIDTQLGAAAALTGFDGARGRSPASVRAAR